MRHRAPRSLKLPIPSRLPAPVHRKRAAGVAVAVVGLGTVTGVALANQNAGAPAEDLQASDITLAPGTTSATGSDAPSAGVTDRGAPTSRDARRTAIPEPAPTSESPGGSVVNPRVPSTRLSLTARVGGSKITASTSTSPSTRASGSSQPSRSSSPSGSSSPSPSGPATSPTPSLSPSLSPSAADTTAPRTNAISVATVAGTWTIALTADERATFECSLDGGAWEPCDAAVSYPGLDHGSHTFAARATDTAGNTDPSPAQLTTKVTGPVLPGQ